MQGRLIKTWLLVLLILPIAGLQDSRVAYEFDFQHEEPGTLPKDFKVTLGEFKVKEEGGNRFLELQAGALDSFGVLLGPELMPGGTMRARLSGWTTGKRFPEFGIGMGGVSGYRLWLMPVTSELEIVQNREVISRVPFTWKDGAWTWMNLGIEKLADSKWQVVGKAWTDGDAEPEAWMIRAEVAKEPSKGRDSLWGNLYSEKPVQFDDIRIQSN